MALNLGDIFFQLGANTRGLNKAGREMVKFVDKTERQYKRIPRVASREMTVFVGKTSMGFRRLPLVANRQMAAFVRTTERGFRRATRTANRETKKLVKTTEKRFARMGRAMRLALTAAALATGLILKRLILLADEYNILQLRIKAATQATDDYAEVTKELFAISNRTGTALKDNVSLFQTLARTAPELGAVNKDMLVLTETLGQLGVIGGSNAQQMRNGLLQFSQAMAGGILRAEEMNGILENIPEIANRIAIGMGMTVGQMRLAALKGKVLSQDVFDALQKQAVEISEEFRKMPLVISRTSVALGNSFMQFVGEVDQAAGITAVIAASLLSASQYLDAIDIDSFVSGMERAAFYMAAFAAVSLVPVTKAMWAFTAAIIANRKALIRTGWGAVVVIAGELVYQLSRVEGVTDAVSRAFGALAEWWEWFADFSGLNAALRLVGDLFASVANTAVSDFEKLSDAISILPTYVTEAFDIMDARLKYWKRGIDIIEETVGQGVKWLWLQGQGEVGTTLREMREGVGLSAEALAIQKDMEVATANELQLTNDALAALKERGATNEVLLAERLAAIEATKQAELQAILDVEAARALAEKNAEIQIKYTADFEGRNKGASLAADGRLIKRLSMQAKEREAARVAAEKALVAKRKVIKKSLEVITKGLLTDREKHLQHYKQKWDDLNWAEQQNIETLIPYAEIRKRMAEQEAADYAELLAKRTEALRDNLQQIAQSLMTESELLTAHHKTTNATLKEGLDRGILTFTQYTKQKEQIAAEHEVALAAIGKGDAKDDSNIEAIRESFMTQAEVEAAFYADRISRIVAAHALEQETTEAAHLLIEQEQRRHTDALAEIDKVHLKGVNTLKFIFGKVGLSLSKENATEEEKANEKAFYKQISLAEGHSKTLFNLQKSLAMAQALIDAPAAVLSSFKHGSTLGGPTLGYIYAGIAAAATATQIAAISSAQFTGSKAMGGNVFAGGMYNVAEQGPELLSMRDGRQALLMGNQSGTITPNHKLGSGGGGGSSVTVNVYPLSGETAQVTSRETDDGTQIDIMMEKIDESIAQGIAQGTSATNDAMTQRFNLNSANGGY